MAITRNQLQIQFSGANSIVVAATGYVLSEERTISANCIGLNLSVKADNNGTPASTDQVTTKVLFSNGDPDGSSTYEFDTRQNANPVFILDTNLEDPAICSIDLPPTATRFKIYCQNDASGNAMTVSAKYTEVIG